MLRPDHRAMKAMYKQCGLGIVREWQRQPFVQDTSWQPESGVLLRTEVIGAFDHLLWDDAVYYVHDAVDDPTFDLLSAMGIRPQRESYQRGDNVYLMRVQRNIDFFSSPHTFAFAATEETRFVEHFMNECEDRVLISQLIFARDGFFGVAQYGVCNKTGTTVAAVRAGQEEEADTRYSIRVAVQTAAATTRRLAECPEHPVMMTPAARRQPKTPKQRKTEEKKPWLREDLSSVIWLDPNRAVRSYGHPGKNGTHASPHPHGRRGHWRELRAERWKNRRGERIWVRPTWVGDREWFHKGAHYQVLEEEVDHGEKNRNCRSPRRRPPGHEGCHQVR